MYSMKQKVGFVKVLICVFIAIVLAFGGIMGLVSGVKAARALVSYDGLTIDDGGINYLAAYYKTVYIRNMRMIGVDASDTDEFWQSTTPDGTTYAKDFNSSFKDYLRSLLAAANIYESYAKYTLADKRAVSRTTDEILKYKADGSVDEFNQLSEKYGFDYNDFERVAALLYKASMAGEVIFGADGMNLKNYPDLCEEYLGKYSHVSLLFVKINDDMSEDEKAAKQEIIDTLSAAIEAKNTGNNGQITEIMFENYLKNSDGDPDMYDSGYYFRRGADMTAEFADAFPEIVDASILMSVGEYRMVECSIGVCFIYKSSPIMGAYSDESNIFFSDFYSDAAVYHYDKILSELKKDVSFTNRYSKLNPSTVPVLVEFQIKEFKSAE